MNRLAGASERAATFVFLVLFAGIMWPPDAYFSAPLPPQGASNIYDFSEFAALLAFLALGFFVWRRDLPRLAVWAWPVLALAALAFLSAFWSEEPSLVLRRAGTVTLSTLFGIYLVARGDLGTLVATLVKVYAIAAVASLLLAVAMPQFGTMTGEAYTHAWRGAFADKNDLGMACSEAIILAVYAFRRRYGARWIAVFTITASLILLYESESKTPVVVMMAALYAALLVMALRRRSGTGLLTAFVLFVVGLVVGALLAVGWQDALAALGRDPTFTNRTRIWRLVLDYIARRPWLGYGYGGFWREDSVDANLIWSLVGFKTPHAHNSWLETGLGLGVVGVGVAALAWLAAFYRTLRVAAAVHAEHVAFCLALLAGIFFENLTEVEFFRPGRLMWALFVAVLVYLGREASFRRDSRAASQRARSVAIPITYSGVRGALAQ
jgi:exopolysaccharide production protein ExoQ